MGTNYYLHRDACEHCGVMPGPLHIGKSSAGWVFSLCIHPDKGINGLPDWRRLWTNARIQDEYGQAVTPAQMLEIIQDRSAALRHRSMKWLNENHAEPGPRGLVRHRIDGTRCVGHGGGTYDLMVGDFC